MDKDVIWKGLADRFVNYQKLSTIPIVDNHDEIIDTDVCQIQKGFKYSLIEPSTGEQFFLRKEVCKKLILAQNILSFKNKGYVLVLTYAYRSMLVQQSNFLKMKAELGLGDRNDPEALEQVHHFIAVPDVAGHPTGGAVDVLIEDKDGNPLDFGTPMHGLEKNSYAFSPFISDEATVNRKLLRLTMQRAGFAPYDGEWWHFSYGDREWAAYYNEPIAFYGQKLIG
jgi:zinc D-Ala-D-Ala dipeptidase